MLQNASTLCTVQLAGNIGWKLAIAVNLPNFKMYAAPKTKLVASYVMHAECQILMRQIQFATAAQIAAQIALRLTQMLLRLL